MDIFEKLPVELHEKIIEDLSIQDLLNCSQVSKSWRSYVNIDKFWKQQCLTRCFRPYLLDELNPGKGNDHSHTSNLEPLCKWREIFAWHNRLRNNWIDRNFKRYKLCTEKCESSVFCLDSDGTWIVSGHGDSRVNIWKVIDREPHYVHTFFTVLDSVPVLSVRLYKDYIIVLQKKLLQIYRREIPLKCTLVDAKSFELGINNMTLNDNIYLLGEKFDFWYKECLRINDHCNIPVRKLIFAVTENLLFASLSGSDTLGVWRVEGYPRASFSGYQPIRNILVCGRDIYIVSGNSDTVLSKYSLSRNETQTALRVPGWKEISIFSEYIVAVPNPMDTTLKRLRVWDRNHALIRSRKLSFGHVSVASVHSHVMFSENSQITVWDPKKDLVLNIFSVGMAVGFIRPAFSTLLIVFMNASVHVVDYIQGKRLYRMYSELEWPGDFREQLWVNPLMVVTGGIEKQMELLIFTD